MTVEGLHSRVGRGFLGRVVFHLSCRKLVRTSIRGYVLSLHRGFCSTNFRGVSGEARGRFSMRVGVSLGVPSRGRFSVGNGGGDVMCDFSSRGGRVLRVDGDFFALAMSVSRGCRAFSGCLSLLTRDVRAVGSASPCFRILEVKLEGVGVYLLSSLTELSGCFAETTFGVSSIVGRFRSYSYITSGVIAILSGGGCRVGCIEGVRRNIVRRSSKARGAVCRIIISVSIFGRKGERVLSLLYSRRVVGSALRARGAVRFNIFVGSLDSRLVRALGRSAFRSATVGKIVWSCRIYVA